MIATATTLPTAQMIPCTIARLPMPISVHVSPASLPIATMSAAMSGAAIT